MLQYSIGPSFLLGHYQVSALNVAVHNLQGFSEGIDIPDIQPQVLLQWTSGLLHYQRNQQIIAQRHTSRLLMCVLQYDEITQVALEMVTPQSKGNDLIQEIRRTSSAGQRELVEQSTPNLKAMLCVFIPNNRSRSSISDLCQHVGQLFENSDN